MRKQRSRLSRFPRVRAGVAAEETLRAEEALRAVASLRGRLDRLESELRRHTESAPPAARLIDLLSRLEKHREEILGEREELRDKRSELNRQAARLRLEVLTVQLGERESELALAVSEREEARNWAQLRRELAEADWEVEAARAEREAGVLDAETDLAKLEQVLRELCGAAVREDGQALQTRIGDAENRRDRAERALQQARDRADERLARLEEEMEEQDECWEEVSERLAAEGAGLGPAWRDWAEAALEADWAETHAADLQRDVDRLRDELDRLAVSLSSPSQR